MSRYYKSIITVLDDEIELLNKRCSNTSSMSKSNILSFHKSKKKQQYIEKSLITKAVNNKVKVECGTKYQFI